MRFLATALILVGLTACGKEKAPSDFTVGEGVSTGGQPCSEDVIEENNHYVRTCGSMTTRQDAQRCREAAERFIRKYPGLYCEALRETDKTPFFLTEARVREVLEELQKIGM